MADPSDEGEFRRSLEARLKRANRNADLNRWIGYGLVFSTIVSSFIALILATTDDSERFVPVFAALPALFTALNAAFNFDQRANWFRRRAHALQRIHWKLCYPKEGKADIHMLSNELGDLLEELSADFPQLSAADFKPPPKPAGA